MVILAEVGFEGIKLWPKPAQMKDFDAAGVALFGETELLYLY